MGGAPGVCVGGKTGISVGADVLGVLGGDAGAAAPPMGAPLGDPSPGAPPGGRVLILGTAGTSGQADTRFI